MRTLDRVRELLSDGVERAIIGSIAVTAPDEVVAWLREVDPERLVLALDVRIDAFRRASADDARLAETSDTTLWKAVERYVRAGARHVLCTDVARDGALTGPNFELYAEAVRRFPELHVAGLGRRRERPRSRALRECGVSRRDQRQGAAREQNPR